MNSFWHHILPTRIIISVFSVLTEFGRHFVLLSNCACLRANERMRLQFRYQSKGQNIHCGYSWPNSQIFHKEHITEQAQHDEGTET